jgi:hypothetical protein
MKIMSTSRIAAITKHVTCVAVEGVEKNRRMISRRPRVKVVYEKSKKPDPLSGELVCKLVGIFGGTRAVSGAALMAAAPETARGSSCKGKGILIRE